MERYKKLKMAAEHTCVREERLALLMKENFKKSLRSRNEIF